MGVIHAVFPHELSGEAFISPHVPPLTLAKNEKPDREKVNHVAFDWTQVNFFINFYVKVLQEAFTESSNYIF